MAVTAFTVAFGSCEDFYTMNIVIATKTKDWPSGKSWEILKELQEEYAPTDLMGDAEQQKELEAIRMKKYENPKMLFSQITSIENKYKGRASALTEKAKLTNVILRSPRMYQVTIQTTQQLTKREIPPREPTVRELRKDMYDLWRATVEPYNREQQGKSHHQEMLLYTGDDSDGSIDSQKKWNNKKKSRRNNPQENRR